jgi:hypothetical protein
MTLTELADTPLTVGSRDLSQDLFGREYQLEVAVAVVRLEAGFVIDDLYMEARRRAADAGLDPPKESAVRKSLAKLVAAGAVDVLPPARRGSPGYYSPAADSAFWPFALQLATRN